MQSEEFIQSLIEQVRQIMNQAEKLDHYDLPTLTWKRDPDSWNILECLEHLNLYGDYYLPQVAKKINSSGTQPDAVFKNGWLGGYFSKSMLPKEKLNRMNTFKDKNPLDVPLGKEVIGKFIGQQVTLLNLLQRSRTISLNKVKIATSISKLIRLKLGDTFQFFINHIIRHMKQVERIQAEMKQAMSGA